MHEENKKRVKLLERASNQANKEENEQEGFDWDDDEEHSKGKLHGLKLKLKFALLKNNLFLKKKKLK